MTTDIEKLKGLLEKVREDRRGVLEWFADMDKFELCLDWPRETIGKFACGPRAAYAALPLAAEALTALPSLLTELSSLRERVEADQWQPGGTAPRDGGWFVGKLLPKHGFSGEEYPPAVMRLTGPHYNFKTGERDEYTVEAKAFNSGTSGGFDVDDIWLWMPLPPLPSPPQGEA